MTNGLNAQIRRRECALDVVARQRYRELATKFKTEQVAT